MNSFLLCSLLVVQILVLFCIEKAYSQEEEAFSSAVEVTAASYTTCLDTLFTTLPSGYVVSSFVANNTNCPSIDKGNFIYATITNLNGQAIGATSSGCVVSVSFDGLPSGWIITSTSSNTGSCPSVGDAEYTYVKLTNQNGQATAGTTVSGCVTTGFMGLPSGWMATSTSATGCKAVNGVPLVYSKMKYLASYAYGSTSTGCVLSASFTGIVSGWMATSVASSSSCGAVGPITFTSVGVKNLNGITATSASFTGYLAPTLGGLPWENGWIATSIASSTTVGSVTYGKANLAYVAKQSSASVACVLGTSLVGIPWQWDITSLASGPSKGCAAVNGVNYTAAAIVNYA